VQIEDVMTRLTTWSRKRGRLPGLGISQIPLASTNKTGSYWLETMGCQMNVADSERMEGQLSDLGFAKAATKVYAGCCFTCITCIAA
jgi:Uncharacterized protein family UPF0004